MSEILGKSILSSDLFICSSMVFFCKNRVWEKDEFAILTQYILFCNFQFISSSKLNLSFTKFCKKLFKKAHFQIAAILFLASDLPKSFLKSCIYMLIKYVKWDQNIYEI